MFFTLTSEYIQYLNDPDCSGMNYDQWKDKKERQKREESKKRAGMKDGYSSKYNK